MASAARLARNRRTVANVIALGQGGGVPADALTDKSGNLVLTDKSGNLILTRKAA